MSQHVFARVSGFGWTLLPLAPFRYERLQERPPAVLAVHENCRATLTFGGGDPAAELGEGTLALDDVLDLPGGPGWDHWRVETTDLGVAVLVRPCSTVPRHFPKNLIRGGKIRR